MQAGRTPRGRRWSATRVSLPLLLAVLVIAGCGPAVSSSAPGSPSTSVSSSPSTTAPAGAPTDAAPIDAGCPTSNTVGFAKTKFVAHAGLAFGAFHRYLWKPYRDGTFSHGGGGRVLAFAKAGLAALFVKREIRLADEDATANPTLCRAIAAPLAAAGNEVQSALDKVKGGDGSALDTVNSSVSSVETAAGRTGAPIAENADPDLSAAPR